jgi:hypothetical protein
MPLHLLHFKLKSLHGLINISLVNFYSVLYEGLVRGLAGERT